MALSKSNLMESKLHDIYKSRRIKGEWFTIYDTDIEAFMYGTK